MTFDTARAKSLFLAALDLADQAARAAYLDRECGGEAELRDRVETLLRASDRAPLLESGRANVAGSLDSAAPGLAPTTNLPGRDEQAGVVIAGKYTLTEVIGEGGMGSVWRAKQSEPVKRYVAIKLIKAGMDSKQVLARFDAERQALALMDHPNIAKVLDGGLHAHRPFFVMELVKGVPITEYCDAHKLTPKERLELFVPVCQAIQHAHQKGIIHRDIKPSNVLIALYDDKPVVKVIDFGVAKATGGTLTEQTLDTGFGAVVGTPQYMSPEQASFNNADIDTRSDVYALGVLLYELLAGSPPFSKNELEKRGLLEMLRVVREEEPLRPSTKLSTADALPSISANRGTEPKKLTGLLRNELDWIVMKALEKDRTRRYETANGFAADVRRYLGGEAVQAHPPSTAYRLQKFVRRNKGQVIAASLVLLALLTGMVGTTIGLFEAKRQEAAKDLALVKEQEQRVKAEANERAAVKAQVQEAAQRTKAEASELQAMQSLAAEKAARTHARSALDTLTEEVVVKLLAQKTKLGTDERAFLTKALTLYDGLTNDQEDTPEGRSIRANGYLNVGRIHEQLGNFDEVEAALVVANDLYDRVVIDAPNTENRSQRNLVRKSLAGTYANRQRPVEAKKLFLAVIEDEERLHAEYPGELNHRSALAISILNYCIFNKKLSIDVQEAYFLRAREHLEAVTAGPESAPRLRLYLSSCLNNLGAVAGSRGQFNEARDHFEQALAFREQLALEYPGDSEHQDYVARAATNLAQTLNQLREFESAERAFEKAVKVREQLATTFAGFPLYRRDLAHCLDLFATFLDRCGKHAEAEAILNRAVTILDSLVKDHPEMMELRPASASIACNLGRLIRDQGKPAESLEWFTRAIRTLASLHEGGARDVKAQQFHRNSHSNRAIAYDQLHQYSEAIADWDLAIELSSKEEQPQYRASRATSRFNAGLVTEAAADWEKILELAPDNPEVLNQLAWPLVATPDKDGRYPLAGKAVEWSRRACELAPDNGGMLNTLGLALYRTEQWQPAIDALQKSTDHGAEVPHNWLFIAMAFWHMGDKAQAKQWYNKSLGWQTANQPAATADQELRSFYAEAAKLMATPNTPDHATPGNP